MSHASLKVEELRGNVTARPLDTHRSTTFVVFPFSLLFLYVEIRFSPPESPVQFRAAPLPL